MIIVAGGDHKHSTAKSVLRPHRVPLELTAPTFTLERPPVYYFKLKVSLCTPNTKVLCIMATHGVA